MMNERQETAKTFLAILMAGVGLFLSAEAHAKTVKVEMTAVETEVVVDGEGTKYARGRSIINFQDLSFVSSKAIRSTLRSPILPATRGRIRWTFMRPKPAF